MKKYQCPCCGYYTYNVPANEDCGFICPVCFWENAPYIASDSEPNAVGSADFTDVAQASDSFSTEINDAEEQYEEETDVRSDGGSHTGAA